MTSPVFKTDAEKDADRTKAVAEAWAIYRHDLARDFAKIHITEGSGYLMDADSERRPLIMRDVARVSYAMADALIAEGFKPKDDANA